MNNADLVAMIYKVVKGVEHRRLNQLRLEEEILTALIQNPNQSLSVKSMALQRISVINQSQLEMLGAAVSQNKAE